MRAVLMLHGIDDARSVLSVSAAELMGLIRGIQASGHSLVSLGRLLSEPDVPDRVALTFDDGFASVAEVAAPILRRAGAPATLFLTTGRVGRDNRWASQPRSAPGARLLTWAQVEELSRAGWEVEAHSRTHPDLRGLGEAELEDEVGEPQREIERRIGRRPEIFAYPYGRLDERVVAAVRRRYRWAVTTRMAALRDGIPDPHRVPRIDAWYLRRAPLQRRFGRPSFRLYVASRSLLRRFRSAALDPA
jgi:peptidoglycan/xylan/chitin deacetylase (PgdA/CDA1 family)